VLRESHEQLSTAYGLSDPRARATSQWLADLYRRTNRAELGDKLAGTEPVAATPISTTAPAAR
jgi:hypothetical protein